MQLPCILVVYYLHDDEDVSRLCDCAKSLPIEWKRIFVGFSSPGVSWPIKTDEPIQLPSNLGKAYAVNLVLGTMIPNDPIVVMDGDIILPDNFAFEVLPLVYLLEIYRVITFDQTGDRRHSPNVPSQGTNIIECLGLAGGCMLIKSNDRLPYVGAGYQSEDVLFFKGSRVAICTWIKVHHPFVHSQALIQRQIDRFGFSPRPV